MTDPYTQFDGKHGKIDRNMILKALPQGALLQIVDVTQPTTVRITGQKDIKIGYSGQWVKKVDDSNSWYMIVSVTVVKKVIDRQRLTSQEIVIEHEFPFAYSHLTSEVLDVIESL